MKTMESMSGWQTGAPSLIVHHQKKLVSFPFVRLGSAQGEEETLGRKEGGLNE